MTKFRDLQICFKNNEDHRQLQNKVIFLYELFLRLLKETDWNCNYFKIALILVDKSSPLTIEDIDMIYLKEVVFDKVSFIESSKAIQKSLIVNLIYNELMEFSKLKGYETQQLDSVKKKCYEMELNNRWVLEGKMHRSKDHQHFAKIYCDWSELYLSVELHLFNGKKGFIKKCQWFKINTRTGYIIYSMQGKWITQRKFSLQSIYYGSYEIDILDFNIDIELDHHIK